MDVGENTLEPSGKSGKSFFERAKDCVKKIILRKMLTKPNDEVGIVLFGSDDTKNDLNSSDMGFEHVVEVDTMQMCTWDMLKSIDTIKTGHATCDWVDALLVGINYTRSETE
jgi:ATP-dependent DNA helicase 2 subunit 2